MYNIIKCYEGSPSKNKTEEKGLTFEEAKAHLDINESLWKKHGGLVRERTEFGLVCEESDASEVITWVIQEREDE